MIKLPTTEISDELYQIAQLFEVNIVEIDALNEGTDPFTAGELAWFEAGERIDLNHRGIALQ